MQWVFHRCGWKCIRKINESILVTVSNQARGITKFVYLEQIQIHAENAYIRYSLYPLGFKDINKKLLEKNIKKTTLPQMCVNLAPMNAGEITHFFIVVTSYPHQLFICLLKTFTEGDPIFLLVCLQSSLPAIRNELLSFLNIAWGLPCMMLIQRSRYWSSN